MKDDGVLLSHALDCITSIEKYVSEGEIIFFIDNKTQDAVLRKLHTMAESIQKISDVTKKAYPEVAWRNISGFRNVMVHDYFDTDLEQIWRIVTNDLPTLKAQLHKIILK